MKNSMKHVFCFIMLFAVASSCGKENKSGGGSSTSTTNPLLNIPTNLPASSTQALQMLSTWYANPDVNITTLGVAGSFQRITKSLYAGNSNSGSNSAFQFNFQFNIGTSNSYSPTHCYVGTIGSTLYSVGTPSGTQCNNRVSMPITSNVKVQQALTAITGVNSSLRLLDVVASGTKYVLRYTDATNVNSYNPSVLYVIDTSAHSILNPVETVDYRTGQRDYLYGRQVWQYQAY